VISRKVLIGPKSTENFMFWTPNFFFFWGGDEPQICDPINFINLNHHLTCGKVW